MASTKEVWLETANKEVVTTALEAGLAAPSAPLTLLFDESASQLASDWKALGRFRVIYNTDQGRLVDEDGRDVGALQQLAGPDHLRTAEAAAASFEGAYVIDAQDWKIIPAENLVALFQARPEASLLAVAQDASTAQTFLGALEAGCGVVLRTDDPGEVRQLARFVTQAARQAASALTYEAACVTSVKPVGMGDRACVDLASLCQPGEGMLLGNFARALFLVHSECAESSYIASRPFRVNAGPVHAYVQGPEERTAYLSELHAGSEVLVADATGRTRRALVGRVKIEARPLVLVTAATSDGQEHSILLQNAETVKLVGPPDSPASGAVGGGTGSARPEEEGYIWQRGDRNGRTGGGGGGGGGGGVKKSSSGGDSGGSGRRSSSDQCAGSRAAGWRAIPVSQLQAGDEVFVLRQNAARHTGISIEEQITEK